MNTQTCLALLVLASLPAFVAAQAPESGTPESVLASDIAAAAERLAVESWPSAGSARAGVELSATTLPGELISSDDEFVELAGEDGASELVSLRRRVARLPRATPDAVHELLSLEVYVASSAATVRRALLLQVGQTHSRAEIYWSRELVVDGQAVTVGEVSAGIQANDDAGVLTVGVLAFVRANVLVVVRASCGPAIAQVLPLARTLDQAIAASPAAAAAGARLDAIVLKIEADAHVEQGSLIPYAFRTSGDQALVPVLNFTGGGLVEGHADTYYAGDAGAQTITAMAMDRFGYPSSRSASLVVGERK